MTLEELTAGFEANNTGDSGLGSTVKFNFGDDGCIHLDAKSVPHVISNEDKEADCTLTISMEDFMYMRNGEMDGTTAFMMGKLKIEGDMGIAMKLQSVLKN
jgi:putative sterol carrier protein